eukprot:TRINITY_DN313_c0_g5_i1.p1 TRINITY_DN313_c0_g5~~TRINITY_DN313_c0_g5_i1.p1  ORF type:complete len:279 (-),score=132.74 TRINITY_DN313_c0_g5_i1:64-900(-)
MRNLKVALFQGGILRDINYNLNCLKEQASIAKSKGAHVIVFPELYLTGYFLGSEILNFGQLLNDNNENIQKISQIAAIEQIYIIVGYPELDHSNKLYNSAAIFDNQGKLILNYRKVHLYGDYEQQYFTPGDRFCPIFMIENIKIAVAICWDNDFVECPRSLRLAGAEVLIVCTANWDIKGSQIVSRARAFENQLFVCYANFAALDSLGANFSGDSCILDTAGDFIANSINNQSQLIIGNIKPDSPRYAQIQALNPILSSRRPNLYSNITKQLSDLPTL